MWSTCHPKSDEDLQECAALGKSLNRLSQPTILTLLAQNQGPMHGYIIVQAASHSPMFGGKKPDATGIYRALKRMEEAGLVSSEWETPSEGSAKRQFSLTEKGYRCLRRWIDALACYELTIEELRAQAACALGIDLPDTPECAHSLLEPNVAEVADDDDDGDGSDYDIDGGGDADDGGDVAGDGEGDDAGADSSDDAGDAAGEDGGGDAAGADSSDDAGDAGDAVGVNDEETEDPA